MISREAVVVFFIIFQKVLSIELDCGTTYPEVSELCAIAHANIDSPMIFKNTEGKTKLNFYSCELKVFPREIFSQFKELRVLYIPSNEVSQIPANSFEKASTLTAIDLSRNRLEFIQSKIFVGASNLVFLKLWDNHIESIANDAFDGLNNLEKIELGQNSITNIDAEVFAKLTKIKTIDLHYNDLEWIHPMAFARNEILETLDLEGNKLVNLELFLSTKVLTLFEASLNALNQLFLRFKSNSGFPEYSSMELSIMAIANNISSIFIDSSLQPAQLNLKSNMISDMTNITKLSSLQRLHVSQNPLTENPLEFSNLSSLVQLDLSSSNATYTETTFDGLTELVDLKLSNCALKKINLKWFNNLDHLQKLDLSDNQLEEFDYRSLKFAFSGLLYLGNNKFSCNYLKDMIQYLKEKSVAVIAQSLDCTVEVHPPTETDLPTTTMPQTTTIIHNEQMNIEFLSHLVDDIDEIKEGEKEEIEDSGVIIEEIKHESAHIEHDISIIKLLIIVLLILSSAQLVYLTLTHLQFIFRQRKTKSSYMHFTDIKTTTTFGEGLEDP